MPKRLAFYVLLALSLALGACSTPPAKKPPYVLNSDYSATGHNSRVRHIVIHYTASPLEHALKTLTQGQVSSHYLISAGPNPVVYQLVDEHRRAWHAGLSRWYEHTDLNTSSLGIELVNAGPLNAKQWAPYTSAQIEILMTLLQDLVARHQVAPENIVGHSDVAPQRKIDPGPLFPWKQLAEAGLGRWFDAEQAQAYALHYATIGLPDSQSTQLLLKNLGYPIATDGIWDQSSQNVLRAFQMHYRPCQYDGELDAETAGILRALQPYATSKTN